MPVQIGAPVHSFSDPTGLLSDCHRRIEMFLRALASVGEVIDRPPSEETRRALENALRYFAEAAPKHTADEEESLFPRMRKMNNADVRSAFEKLDRLEDDHQRVAPLHERVDELGKRYLSNGNLADREVEEFRNSVGDLIAMYQEHIRIEDELIFPMAARTLSDSEKAAVALEMTGRRNRSEPSIA